MVLDGVVCSAWDEFGDLCPLISPLLVCIVDDLIFLVRPGGLLDVGVEMVVPTFTTLLANATLEMFCD